MLIKGPRRTLLLLAAACFLSILGCAGVRPCPVTEADVDTARQEADRAERTLAPVLAERDSLQSVIDALEAARDSLRTTGDGLR